MAGVLPRRKTKEMNAKDFETVLNDISSDINEVFTLITQKCKELENDLLELKNQREQSLKEAFEKGYEEGVKYTDGLINDERFPF